MGVKLYKIEWKRLGEYSLDYNNLEKIEMKKLDTLIDYEQPTKYIVKTTDYNDKYKTPVLTAGQTFILGYTDETKGIYEADKNNPVIIFDDFTTGNHWVDFNFKIKSSAMKILKPKEGVNLRYCYHYMQTLKLNITEHRRMWITKYSQIKIPLPSPAVQKYIVSILDKFDTLINDISAGLPKEIELRQKQYEYYRERLLDFPKK
ncbi:MAG: restriction endonuclease subunit S [Treponemataceae bacterium]